jgi:predicted nucleotidyltransferase
MPVMNAGAALLKTSNLNYNEQHAIAGVLMRVPAVLTGLSCIVLYGSKARGDSLEESDIDLLIVTQETASREMKFNVYDIIYDFEVEYDVVISAVFATDEAYNARTSPFLRKVQKEGILLWSRE